MIPEETLRKMDVKELADLYSQQVKALNAKLLAGTDWMELTELRHYLTQIGVAIDVKLAEKAKAL